MGAVKVTLAPVVDDKPVAGDQVKLTVPDAGSIAVAFRVTDAPLATVMVVPVTVGPPTLGPPGT
jgi:hypothetical protein